GVPQRRQFPQVLTDVEEVADDRFDAGEVLPEELLQPAAAVAQRDPTLGAVHAHLGPLPPQRLAQPRQRLYPGQVAGLPRRPRALGPGPVTPVLGHGVVDHGHRGHAALGGAAVRALLAGPGQVGGDVGHGLALGVLVPGPVAGFAKGLTGCRSRADPLSRRLGGPLDGRFRDVQRRQPRQHLLGRLGETGLHAGQADDLVGGGRQVMAEQPQALVLGAVAVPAARAVVVVAQQPHRPQQADEAARAEALAAGRFVAAGATHAGALVPPFFRPSRAACSVLAAREWARSRSWNSVRPSSWASGLLA